MDGVATWNARAMPTEYQVGGCCRKTEEDGGERWLSGRTPESQSREPGFESPLLPFRRLGIFVLSTMPQLTQLYK